jgi:hypothetical protein
MRQVGYGLGIAGLGAVLNVVSWRRLDEALASTPALAGIDGAKAFAAFESGMAPQAGVQGARLADLVLGAFGHGMEIMLVVAGAVTLAGAVAALVLVRDSGIESRAGAGAVAPSE